MNQSVADQTKRDLVGWIRLNWVWAAPLIYIYVTVVGMIQAWLQFDAFDINVFEFSEINDFLLAAFREPLSFLYILGIIAYGGVLSLAQLILIPRILKSKSSEKITRIHRVYLWITYSSFVAIIIMAPYLVPRMLNKKYGEEWKKEFLSKKDRQVQALVKDLEKKDGIERGWIKNLTLIGTTDKFVFFFNRSTKEILVAPLNNILVIKRIN